MGYRRLLLKESPVIAKRPFVAVWAAALPAIAAVVLIGVMTGVGGGGPPVAMAMMSTKPVLTSLTVSAGTLSPSFSGTEVEYTV